MTALEGQRLESNYWEHGGLNCKENQYFQLNTDQLGYNGLTGTRLKQYALLRWASYVSLLLQHHFLLSVL